MTDRIKELTQINRCSQLLPLLSEKKDVKTFDSPLSASILNIDAKSRGNLFPWRGQFSPQLVEALLRTYAATGSVVLDPFMGSGTVLVESARQNLQAYGFEINPAACLLARAYEFCNLPIDKRQGLLDKAESMLALKLPNTFELPLFRSAHDEPQPHTGLSEWIKTIPDANVQILLKILVILVNEDLENDHLYTSKWSTIRKIVTELPFSENPVCARLGDARALSLPNGSIDFVLSSPPYINVFNYHHNSRLAIESLGWKPLIIARSEIGSNRKFRQNRFLTVIQYCIDMALALVELHRVCSRDARILLILGRESNVHKTAFLNSQIIEQLATDIVGLRLVLKQERVFLNRFGQRIYEDVLHFQPTDACVQSKEQLIESARGFGKNSLLEAIGRTPDDRKRYLHDAIVRANEVEASPILEVARMIGGIL